MAMIATRVPWLNTVRGKLMFVVLVTTTIALTIAAAGLLLTDVRETRAEWAEDLATQAGILALSTAPALSFDDRESARRNLSALRARPTIDAAAIYAADGRLYASYQREGGRDGVPESVGAGTVPGAAGGDGAPMEFVQPVIQNGETLGMLYLRARYDLAERVGAYFRVLAGVMLVSLVLALLASRWLQRGISEPIGAVADIARQIAVRRDYSLRAQTSEKGEIGLVVDAFNGMLDEMQARTREVVASERVYRGIGESIEYGVWICDPEGRCVYASDSFLELTGLTQEQCSVLGWADRLHPDDREATMLAWLECVRRGTPWYREHRILGTDGNYHHVLAQGVPIRDDGGDIIRWAGINLDIHKLKSTEEALREADRRKDEFVATLAHELRNPLAPILNAVRILESPASDAAQQKWCREVIARQVRHMTLLLDDLLDVSRITRGKLEIRRQFVALEAVFEAALEAARPAIDAKGHALTVEMPRQPVTVNADPLRLAQILANLLSNASKYTDRGGRIRLSAAVSGSELVLAVEDSGIGLEPGTIAGLFTIFSQVDSAISRSEGGLGIGLALVRGLAELHGGRVEASSAGPGQGSRFSVYLPGLAAAGEANAARL